MADYSRMSFEDVLAQDCLTYRKLFKDAYIHTLKQSEEGRAYLEECWILRQTKPDRVTLRQFNKKEEGE